MPKIIISWKIIFLGAFFSVWVSLIIASGAGWNPAGVRWDFSNTGSFGDSFGPLSALMASIAALSAILAYTSQREELLRLKAREKAEDRRRAREQKLLQEREEKRDHAEMVSAFEGTFFNLLNAFSKISSQVDIRTGKGEQKTAQDAFQSILNFAEYSRPALSHDLQKIWSSTIQKYKNDLNHYFRFMYQIVTFVDRSQISEKYFYVKLLRSMLSESELILLGLNCEYGDGIERFRPLVEKYSLLKNISPAGLNDWFSETELQVEAFGNRADVTEA